MVHWRNYLIIIFFIQKHEVTGWYIRSVAALKKKCIYLFMIGLRENSVPWIKQSDIIAPAQWDLLLNITAAPDWIGNLCCWLWGIEKSPVKKMNISHTYGLMGQISFSLRSSAASIYSLTIVFSAGSGWQTHLTGGLKHFASCCTNK